MVVNKRSRITRERGNHTHGWGSMKKNRGKGNKGGAGMAGTGKRGDAKKPMIWKNPKYFGKYGFRRHAAKKKIVYVNLEFLEENVEKLAEKGIIEEKDRAYVIDGNKLGFNKVLGYGKLTKKLMITADSFSKGAVKKIKSAGGDAITEEPKSSQAEAGKAKKSTEKDSAEEAE